MLSRGRPILCTSDHLPPPFHLIAILLLTPSSLVSTEASHRMPYFALATTKTATTLAWRSADHLTSFRHLSKRQVTSGMASSVPQSGTHYIDAGANLLDPMYQGSYHGKPRHEPDLDLVLQRSYDYGVRSIISLAGTTEESQQLLALIHRFEETEAGKNDKVHVFGTVGIHPTRCAEEFAEWTPGASEETQTCRPKTERQQKQIIQNLISIAEAGKAAGNVVAIGECGLDYARLQFCPKDIQQIGLRAQLEVAIVTKLPLYLHNRESGEDLYSILLEYKNRLSFDEGSSGIKGIVHSFDETTEIANQFISLGLFIGINGCSLKTPENLATVKKIAIEHIILETDCPWCDIRPTHAGHSYIRTSFPSKKEKQYSRDTGTKFCVKNRTEPCHVLQVAEVVAGIKELDLDEVLDTCCKNACSLFGDLVKKK
ncbi:hypothetical protein ACHAW6_007106 [Cyclotella cf. meneghiniana]